MKYTAALLIAAGLVAAQSPADFFPECSLDCINEAATSATSCSADDLACRCTPENQAAIQGAATSCVIDACGAAVAASEVLPAAEEFCAAVAAGGGSETSAETPAETSAETPAGTSAGTPAETSAEAPAGTSSAGGSPTKPTGGASEPTSSSPVEVNAAGAIAPVGGFAAMVLAALAAF